MFLERRNFILLGGSFLGLAACGAPAPVVLSVNAAGAAGMNPGPDGADRAVTLTVLQMRGSGAFDSADYFALQTPAAALGADLVKSDQLVLAPGGAAASAIPVETGTTVIGVTAGFRDPAGKQFRAKVAVPAKSAGLNITVSGSGVSLQLA